MSNLILILHSLIRWAAIVLGLIAVARALSGVSTNGAWTESDTKFGRLFAISIDVQMLLGLLMYLFLSTITTSAFQNMGGAMSNSVVRFWIVEHPTMMIAALAFGHIGVARARKATEPAAKHRAALIFLGLALVLILVGTPWPFYPAARPLLPFG